MAKYYFTKKAILDLTEIWEYNIETWSETQADKYYHLLIDACNSVTKNPKKGKSYIEIYPYLFGKK
jgi:toxin ParE1/3/4